MEPVTIIIPGIVPVKKNTGKVSMYYKDKQGRTVPRKHPVYYYSTAYKDWARSAIIACQKFKTQSKLTFPLTCKMNMQCIFYYPVDRVVDLSALYEAPQDVLCGKAGIDRVPPEIYQIIQDDNTRFIGSHDGSRLALDPVNPRTVIVLTDFSYSINKGVVNATMQSM
uniref:Uncharacterized protein n=1 Tax=viral metagenome TaxID=1070528 RepID=A0A6H1ZLN5_9ZZZZ